MAKNTGVANVWFFIAYCLLLSYVSSTCYFESGIVAQDFVACNASTVGTTHCCQNNWTCLDTGLCMVSWDTSVNTGSCTDRSWESTDCFRRCPGALGALNTLYRCDDNEWCCSSGGNTTSCCQDPSVYLFELNGQNNPSRVMGGSAFVPGYTIAPIAALEAAETRSNLSCPSNESDGPSISSNASGQSASPSPAICSASSDDMMKTGLGAGLGIGLPLIAALATLLFFLIREKRINRELRQNTGVPFMTTHDERNHGARHSNTNEQHNVHELFSDPATSELPSGGGKVQLPA